MNINKYLKDGYYVDEEGCYYEDAESFIMTGQLDFCGCGMPSEAMTFIRDALQHVNDLRQKVLKNKELSYDQWSESGKKLFSTIGAEYFAYYILDQKELTEHGTSVPGWLTEKGREMLEDMNSLLSNN